MISEITVFIRSTRARMSLLVLYGFNRLGLVARLSKNRFHQSVNRVLRFPNDQENAQELILCPLQSWHRNYMSREELMPEKSLVDIALSEVNQPLPLTSHVGMKL